MSSFISAMNRVAARFHRDRRANVTVMFALSTIPLVGFVGAAVDFKPAGQPFEGPRQGLLRDAQVPLRNQRRNVAIDP